MEGGENSRNTEADDMLCRKYEQVVISNTHVLDLLRKQEFLIPMSEANTLVDHLKDSASVCLKEIEYKTQEKASMKGKDQQSKLSGLGKLEDIEYHKLNASDFKQVEDFIKNLPEIDLPPPSKAATNTEDEICYSMDKVEDAVVSLERIFLDLVADADEQILENEICCN